ncbi:16S rRNA (guanine(966)-N(2))-methyltransferase RsmD [Methylocella silvestris]|uniref:16S rRNA (Guanine(966)-N(2))-methyltransferase RsmD n=1 Tax=Methylocella silvestris TaxID=199596 RepID=A0A2J7TI48_METSI|nr:16S rRNA (guanine(966)-N(2))-methyltransferase RsmD [Methylocella silvestris]PNG26417.1 16S rRNA (guanine(966)-N(2))-methyltransferase RsmD [Methylocella silvestris]
MRIVGGRLKGRSLKGPGPSRAIRPTADRLRESLFDILGHAYGRPREESRVIDLFSGTGALAIEALSRGAGFALLVDQGAEALSVMRANIGALQLADSTRVLRRDARKLGPAPDGERYDLAFLDPPYGKALALPALASLLSGGWLALDALVVIEEAAEAEVALPPGLNRVEARQYGDTQIVFAQCAPTQQRD